MRKSKADTPFNEIVTKKNSKIIILLLFAVFVVAQFFRPNRTTAPIVEVETLEFSAQVPEQIDAILVRSCNDCHTNATNYPWYSNVTPFNFLLAQHVEEGRAELNFSVWNTYETGRKRRKLSEICEQVEQSSMPLPAYLWIHGDARLSAEDVETLCGWTNDERKRLAKAP